MRFEYLVTWRRERKNQGQKRGEEATWRTHLVRCFHQTAGSAEDLRLRLSQEGPDPGSCWCSPDPDDGCDLCLGAVRPAFDIVLKRREVGAWEVLDLGKAGGSAG